MPQRARIWVFGSLLALSLGVFLLAPDSGTFARVPLLVLLLVIVVLYREILGRRPAPVVAQQIDDDLTTVIDLTDVVDLTERDDGHRGGRAARDDEAPPPASPVAELDPDDEPDALAVDDVDRAAPRAGYFELSDGQPGPDDPPPRPVAAAPRSPDSDGGPSEPSPPPRPQRSAVPAPPSLETRPPLSGAGTGDPWLLWANDLFD